MLFIILSRLAITGAIIQSTPLVVIKEIADSHSIKYEEENITNKRYLSHLINTINTKNVHMVKTPYDINDYRLIARFVNSKHKWKRISLNNAFTFLMEYTHIKKLCEIHLDFEYGPQTPEHPYKLNASILYGICNANRIDTCFNSTIDEMASNIKLLFLLRQPNICHIVKSNIQDALIYGTCDGYQLVNILSQINIDKSYNIVRNNKNNIIIENNNIIDNVIITYDDLDHAAKNVQNIHTKPRTHVEAVAMAGIFYKMDISKVKNPLAEYQELTRTPFFPFDRNLAKRILLTNHYPDSFKNPRIDQVFNINLPSSMYDNNDLINMCLDEGYKDNYILEVGSPYELLQVSYLEFTFLHGKQGNIINEETTTLDNISELEYDNVVIYGVRGGNMRAYTYGELVETFKYYNRFQNPADDNGLFSDNVINKLHMLCQKDHRSTESWEIIQERVELVDEIERVKLYMQTNEGQVTEFVDRYRTCSDKHKEKIGDFLIELLHSSMYMRGWSGEGSYPLSTTDARQPVEEYPNILLRVTNSINELENIINSLNNELNGMGNLIKNLPLIFYNNNSDELLPSTDQEEGLTIYERINIVKGGESGSIQSCIRMSSNRFAASAYYYMRLISMPLPFDISNLSHIF